MSRAWVAPEIIEKGLVTGRWMVEIHNNDTNTFDEVIEALMRATGCGTEEAFFETWEAHTYGKAPVHFADRHECEIVAAMIAMIGVRTTVRPEWEE
ncbi:MAG: ATP-dependent Clp protease adaptor ClpS [Fimbriimonadaceae bacterium]